MTALHTIKEAARKLRKSPRWLQDFIVDHPYYRKAGRTTVFTDEDPLNNGHDAQALYIRSEGLSPAHEVKRQSYLDQRG